MLYNVNVSRAEGGGYQAFVPALPGFYLQGKTLDEIAENVTEAVTSYLKSPIFPVSEEYRQDVPIHCAINYTV